MESRKGDICLIIINSVNSAAAPKKVSQKRHLPYNNQQCKEKSGIKITDGAAGLKLMAVITVEVLRDGLAAQLKKTELEAIILQLNDNHEMRKIPEQLIKVLVLFKTRSTIHILYNPQLGRILTAIADLLPPYLTRANKDVVDNLKQKCEFLNR